MKTLKVLFGFVLLNIITACSASDPDAVLKQVFNEKEVILVNQIISYYDNYVLSKTDENKSIKDAYQAFMSKNALSALKAGDLTIFATSRKELTALFETLDNDVFSNLFNIDENYPYQVQIIYPKYLEFMKVLSTRNDFYFSYYNKFEAVGDISPSIYSDIFSMYDEHPEGKKYSETFDFSKKEDRFSFIIPFLVTHENTNHEGMYSILR